MSTLGRQLAAIERRVDETEAAQHRERLRTDPEWYWRARCHQHLADLGAVTYCPPPAYQPPPDPDTAEEVLEEVLEEVAPVERPFWRAVWGANEQLPDNLLAGIIFCNVWDYFREPLVQAEFALPGGEERVLDSLRTALRLPDLTAGNAGRVLAELEAEAERFLVARASNATGLEPVEVERRMRGGGR